jgi:signal transduction histidine kinase
MELSRYRSSLEQIVEEKTRELTIAKEKAEESDKLNSAFLANISHEVRTPLNAIVGLLNALEKEVQLSEGLREYIDIINSNSEILLRLIDDILDVAKIEAKQLTIKAESFCADNIVDEMYTLIETYMSACHKTHIILETVKGGKTGKRMVYADPVRLKQILHNLLNNAVKFTDNGYIRFGYRMIKTDMLEFFVEDTGIGIPENQLDIIFQRFRQVEQGNNRRYRGMGLGLPISRGLAQLMGGNIHVTSAEGKGSTFFFTIPADNVSNFV